MRHTRALWSGCLVHTGTPTDRAEQVEIAWFTRRLGASLGNDVPARTPVAPLARLSHTMRAPSARRQDTHGARRSRVFRRTGAAPMQLVHHVGATQVGTFLQAERLQTCIQRALQEFPAGWDQLPSKPAWAKQGHRAEPSQIERAIRTTAGDVPIFTPQ